MAKRAPPALHSHLLWASWILPALIFFTVLIAVSVVHRQNRVAEALIAKDTLIAKSGELSAYIEHHLNSTLYLGNGLVTYIESQHGQVDPNQIEPWINGLIQQSHHLRNIGIAPGNRLLYVYPKVGNEKAIGLYYPDNPAQWPAVKAVIEKREPVLAGPIALAQGGLGLIYRAPVFVRTEYWGIVSIVINADSLFAEIQKRADALNIQIALFHDSNATQGTAFFGASLPQRNIQVSDTIDGPNVRWYMHATERTPIELSSANAFAFTGIFVAVFVSMLSYLMLRALRRQIELDAALKHSEQRFSQAFRDAPQGMLLVDAQGAILSANLAVLELLGLDHTQIQHRTLASLFGASEAPQCQALFSKIVAGEIRDAKLDTHLTSQQGRHVDVAMSLALLSDGEQQSDRIIVQFHDLSQRLALERMKQDFVSTVSHELRTPITAVSASLMVLASEQLAKLPTTILQLIQIAERNAKRLQHLVNDLLDFDALSSGNLSIHLAECPLYHLVHQSIELAHALAEQKHIAIVSSFSDKNLTVTADGFRLQQVFDNLISNAIKFSHAHARIEVFVTHNDTQAFVSVRDFGQGIHATFLPQLFNRFAQESSGNTRAPGGTGLGLAISKRLMQQMNGDIHVESEEGKGSTFTVSVCLANTTPSNAA